MISADAQSILARLDNGFEIVDSLNRDIYFVQDRQTGDAVRCTMSVLGVRQMIIAYDTLASWFDLPSYDGPDEVHSHWRPEDSKDYRGVLAIVKGAIEMSMYRYDSRPEMRDAAKGAVKLALYNFHSILSSICKPLEDEK